MHSTGMPTNWTYRSPPLPVEIKKYLKIQYYSTNEHWPETLIIEFSKNELAHLTVALIKEKITEKINLPIEDQGLTITFCDGEHRKVATLQDNHVGEDNRFEVLSADNCFMQEAVAALCRDRDHPTTTYITAHISLRESLSFQRRHEQQLRENQKSHTFLIQLDKGELIEVIFSDEQYQSPDFVAIFKRRLFEECGIYEECQYIKNDDNLVDSLETIKLLEQKQLASFDESKIITLSINKELQVKKMHQRKLELQAIRLTKKSLQVNFGFQEGSCGSGDPSFELPMPAEQPAVISFIQEQLLLRYYCPISAQFVFAFYHNKDKGRMHEGDTNVLDKIRKLVCQGFQLTVCIQKNHLSRCKWLKKELEQAQKEYDLKLAAAEARDASSSSASSTTTNTTATTSVDYKQQFHQARQAQLNTESFQCFRKTELNGTEDLAAILQHAVKSNNRSRQVCVKLKWLKADGSLDEKAPEPVRDHYPKASINLSSKR